VASAYRSGKRVHQALHRLFDEHGWDIVFSYEPNSEFTSPLGKFTTNHGILTVKNPDI
jgi:hypothetical protein